MQTVADERHQDIRDAVRALCAEFPAEYHRRIDAERAYPEAFVDALTRSGWMAALIPEEYGGSGLGLTEASPDTLRPALAVHPIAAQQSEYSLWTRDVEA